MTELTDRHRAILALMAEGLTSRQIAQRLGVTMNSVESQRRTIIQRFFVKNTAQMLVKATKMGLI